MDIEQTKKSINNSGYKTATDVDNEKFAYKSARERFGDIVSLTKGLTLRYIRNYSTRMLSDNGNYSPGLSSAREVLYITGILPEVAGTAWLNEHGFPTIGDIELQLNAYFGHVRRRIDATRALKRNIVLAPENIQQQFHLNEYELLLLCVVAAGQVDDEIARLFQFATGLNTTIFPGWFYADLIANDSISTIDVLHLMDPGKPLTMLSLVEVGRQADWGVRTPVLQAPVSVPNRIVSFLLGEEIGSSMPHSEFYHPNGSEPQLSLPDSFRATMDDYLARPGIRLGLYGCKGFGRRSYLREYAAKHKQNVLEVNLSTIRDREPVEDLLVQAGLWFRESRLRNAILLLRCDDGFATEVEQNLLLIAPQLQAMMSNHPGAICMTAFSPTSFIRKFYGPHTEVFCPPPLRGQQPDYWRRALESRLSGDKLEETIDYISSSYCLTPGEIEATITACQARTGLAEVNGEALAETLRTTRGRALEGLADLKPTPLGLKDIVLTPLARATIDEILNFAHYSDMVRHDWGFSRVSSASGLSILFSGPPGTGKTLTAGVIAHELRRALYVIDISRVIDKYIGETEKRLAKIFDHAQTSQAILLFDEADSLFAKRTNVKSSNDRYANIEVNYLLQRLESYNGISILTTNLADSLDEALQRRIQFKIHFPMPNEKERARLWKFLLPKQAIGNETIDYKGLGEEYEMSGGHIKNAVFRACIEAASKHTKVDNEMLWSAGLHELREMGHVIREDHEFD